MATPVFDGAQEENIHHMAEMAEMPKSGQIWLHDGMTGERFSQKVTVGYAYILKLQDVGISDRYFLTKTFSSHSIMQPNLTGFGHFSHFRHMVDIFFLCPIKYRSSQMKS